MLAFGVVFVLLLGEIDLSICYLAGIGALGRGRRTPAAREAGTSSTASLAMLIAIARAR